MILYSLYECLDFKSFLFLICLLLLLIDLIRHKNPANFPPGPWPLPILGNVFTDFIYKTVDQVSKVFKMVKDVLITQGETFTDRPVSPLFDTLYKGRGLSFNNGYSWRKQQQFSMSHLKNAAHLTLWSNNAVANVIGSLLFGHRYEYDDVDFQKLLQMSAESVFLTGSVWNQLHDAFPGIMKWLPGPHQTIISNYQELAYFLKEKVEQHRQDWDSNNPRDYIDAYLTETEKRKNDTEAGFNIDSLVWCTVDLFEGGTETTTNTLRWALLYMIKYPDIQEKVRAEIDQVIGSRPPTMFDKANMHYINAFIHEVLRKPNLVPLNMARTARKNTTLGGYFIPKGTVMITNLTSVLYDKHEWETPDTFNPGHFLDSEGHVRESTWLTWSCSSYFPPPGEELSLESQVGFTQAPLPYKLCAHPR
uniref:Cytochrome P450, family 2, subfamily AD, polypeptide 6 n=1 Tax=Sinocyclocheilus rhinocerous TaxID=307959 RepID=A0A673HA13_9TELE